MARLSALVLAAVFAFALVCGAASVPTSEDTAVLQRVRRFSIEGFLTCAALTGLAGLNDAINEITNDCLPKGAGSFAYRICALQKLAMLGPEYLECVAKS